MYVFSIAKQRKWCAEPLCSTHRENAHPMGSLHLHRPFPNWFPSLRLKCRRRRSRRPPEWRSRAGGHRGALGELHVHLLDELRTFLLGFGSRLHALRLHRQAERPQVAEPHGVACLQSLYDLILQRIQDGFHVGARNRGTFFHALYYLRKCHRCGRCHLRIILHLVLFKRVFLRLDYVLNHKPFILVMIKK